MELNINGVTEVLLFSTYKISFIMINTPTELPKHAPGTTTIYIVHINFIKKYKSSLTILLKIIGDFITYPKVKSV